MATVLQRIAKWKCDGIPKTRLPSGCGTVPWDGLATRILAVLLGFVPALLFATGVLHWLRRHAAHTA